MKVYKLIDHDEIGEDAVRTELECGRFGNRCISPSVVEIEGRDIGEWDDDHPLNQDDTADAEFRRLFGMGES